MASLPPNSRYCISPLVMGPLNALVGVHASYCCTTDCLLRTSSAWKAAEASTARRAALSNSSTSVAERKGAML